MCPTNGPEYHTPTKSSILIPSGSPAKVRIAEEAAAAASAGLQMGDVGRATVDGPNSGQVMTVAVIQAAAAMERPVAGNPAAARAERPIADNPTAAAVERPVAGNPAAATAERPLSENTAAALAERPVAGNPAAATAPLIFVVKQIQKFPFESF
ncbi:hypothetical protein DAPPUDRAFT_114740 [Daphnia pulex]|uniref:Uncharacterized protein n=1 Tax=Daphnia pulex TaxID=6669 RepID=E9HJ40_DAPPU|nr:hypothetical protein DAPPUDRAFT_114740 [Daphnia pulex]|eukprot:EFX68253.1 hypothetical protein DAPPUDRAFT_114740 [Daphnia pulex]